MVDLDGNGTLDFEELVLLMHLYRLHEGARAPSATCTPSDGKSLQSGGFRTLPMDL